MHIKNYFGILGASRKGTCTCFVSSYKQWKEYLKPDNNGEYFNS